MRYIRPDKATRRAKPTQQIEPRREPRRKPRRKPRRDPRRFRRVRGQRTDRVKFRVHAQHRAFQPRRLREPDERRFIERATQVPSHNGGACTNNKWDTPTPALELLIGQELLQNHQHQHCQQQSADQGHVLERSKETAAALERHFTHVGCAGTIFASDRKPLQQACH